MKIKIKHREDKMEYVFSVKDVDKLTLAEVNKICNKMRVKALLVNGKYYRS